MADSGELDDYLKKYQEHVDNMVSDIEFINSQIPKLLALIDAMATIFIDIGQTLKYTSDRFEDFNNPKGKNE